MSSPATPGIAILGAGIFAKEAHLPGIASLGDDAPLLKAVYSRSEKSAQELANSAMTLLKLPNPPSIYHDGNPGIDGVDALLARDDITAVIIALPITTQPSIVLKVLASGKHVLSEKPVAQDVKTGLDLIHQYETQYKPKGLIWRVAENFEAEPGVQIAAKAIRDGKIGDVILFRTSVLNYTDQNTKWVKTPWRTVPDYQGGFVLDGGVHTIAVLRTILPHPLTHISSFASVNKEYLKPHDTINAILKSEGHFHGTLDMTWAFPTERKPKVDGVVITGTKGWMTINISWLPSPTVKVVIHSGKPSDLSKNDFEEVIEEKGRGVEVELRSFFDVISGQNDQLNLGDPKAALRDVAVIQGALNSHGDLVNLAKLVAS